MLRKMALGWFALLGSVVSLAFAQLLPQGLPLDMAEKLADSKHIYVATLRKDGSQSKAAPVWFGIIEGAVWFTTSPDSHKGKRILRGSPVFLSVEGKNGPFVRMRAEIVRDGNKAEALARLYERKYWIAWLGFFRPSREHVESGKTLLVRLVPEELAPAGKAP